MELGSISIAEAIPTLAALVGIGISWGSLASKIVNERDRHDEIVKRIELKIECLEEDQMSMLKDFHSMATKIDTIHERLLTLKICRPDCFFRTEWENKSRNTAGIP